MINTLVVEDEVLVRWALERVLRKWGHSIHSVESVDEARRRLDEVTFDTVIVDLRMQGEDGMVLVEELLAAGYSPERIVVCSAYVSAEQEDELKDRGVGILRKPFTIDELRHTVNGGGERTGRRSTVRAVPMFFPL